MWGSRFIVAPLSSHKIIWHFTSSKRFFEVGFPRCLDFCHPTARPEIGQARGCVRAQTWQLSAAYILFTGWLVESALFSPSCLPHWGGGFHPWSPWKLTCWIWLENRTQTTHFQMFCPTAGRMTWGADLRGISNTNLPFLLNQSFLVQKQNYKLASRKLTKRQV